MARKQPMGVKIKAYERIDKGAARRLLEGFRKDDVRSTTDNKNENGEGGGSGMWAAKVNALREMPQTVPRRCLTSTSGTTARRGANRRAGRPPIQWISRSRATTSLVLEAVLAVCRFWRLTPTVPAAWIDECTSPFFAFLSKSLEG